MEAKRKYESGRGRFHVSVEDKPVIEFADSKFTLDSVEDLIDLFVTIASVLNQIYDDDKFPTQ